MIGVATSGTDRAAVEEFFELFKTPWEPAVAGRKYRVVLSTAANIEKLQADLFLLYGSAENAVDRAAGKTLTHHDGPGTVEWGKFKVPMYGRVATFGNGGSELKAGGQSVDYSYQGRSYAVRRVGYDLFEEVRHLLSQGQPAAHALMPTLELHIAVLRHLLLDSGISFVEVPPRPDEYDFVCCLTHDVDFFGIRRHKLDRTLAGFMVRASVGTLLDLARGRRTVAEAIENWKAFCLLPLVFLGLRKDFWNPFEDYTRLENGRRPTFFLVPFRNRPGVAPDGTVASARAVRYQASDVREQARAISADGGEVAVHGLDAWRDAEAGRSEIAELLALTGGTTAGVRMHWLYFAGESPERLEAAGFEYDSTCGYNEAVGYRAGTSQVFRLPGTQGLMELPLSIMDSALFYPNRMGLAPNDAAELCRQIVSNARRFGGTLVINWHDRSLAPERLWGRFYRDLLDDVGTGNRVWFATAREAVDWFRWRRSIRFTTDTESGHVTVEAGAPRTAKAAASVRIQRPARRGSADAEDRRFDGREAITLTV